MKISPGRGDEGQESGAKGEHQKKLPFSLHFQCAWGVPSPKDWSLPFANLSSAYAPSKRSPADAKDIPASYPLLLMGRWEASITLLTNGTQTESRRSARYLFSVGGTFPRNSRPAPSSSAPMLKGFRRSSPLTSQRTAGWRQSPFSPARNISPAAPFSRRRTKDSLRSE